ncbi:unnamed protein product [Timema podura]|uniref:Uncharacterized protein n=1 Tax=Timema podura TaxID=61482 RepID=A0ABN7NTL6_TIMPD|nr:unnamed protein product [Timema podura]
MTVFKNAVWSLKSVAGSVLTVILFFSIVWTLLGNPRWDLLWQCLTLRKRLFLQLSTEQEWARSSEYGAMCGKIGTVLYRMMVAVIGVF